MYVIVLSGTSPDSQYKRRAAGLWWAETKSRVYTQNATAATTVAEILGFEVSTDGIMAAGWPVGTEAYMSEQANGCADRRVVRF